MSSKQNEYAIRYEGHYELVFEDIPSRVRVTGEELISYLRASDHPVMNKIFGNTRVYQIKEFDDDGCD